MPVYTEKERTMSIPTHDERVSMGVQKHAVVVHSTVWNGTKCLGGSLRVDVILDHRGQLAIMQTGMPGATMLFSEAATKEILRILRAKSR